MSGMDKPLPNGQILEKPPAYHSPPDMVVAAPGSDASSGLTTLEAQSRLQDYGCNTLPSVPPIPAWQRFLAQFRDPLTPLLLAATAISLAVWWTLRDSVFPYEALTIFAIVLLNAILGSIQDYRAEQAVAALQAMSAATTHVLRDGSVQTIPTTEVVPEDILLIEEGDSITADARLLEGIGLRVEETALTGESTPVAKSSPAIEEEVAPADQRNMLFSGTVAVAGRGRAIITATGGETEIGRIAGSLQRVPVKRTPLQWELERIGKWLGIVVMMIALAMCVTILLVDCVGTLSELVDVLLLAVSLAVAAVPEGLTAVFVNTQSEHSCDNAA